ncbi:MAG TPA: CPBP family intramembrane glutamic endopeptidase [Terriglobales bacterium]|jgi:membrane protease YdiL (CAAX protease family)
MASGGAGTRLERSDWRWIAIAVAVAALSLWFVANYFHRAFPQASIDFQVSGPGSQPIAQRFLQAQHLATAGFRHAEQFGFDNQALTFLERELGLQSAEQVLGSRLRLWRWQHRWFKPLTQEEFQVAVSTRGQVVGFNHVIGDNAPGAALSGEAARQIAQTFITSVMHLDWRQWTPVGADREVKPHRVDYVFTWRDAAPLVAGASGYVAQAEHRHVVRVQGDQVGAYTEFLKVPEQWQRDYTALRSKNEAAGAVDSALLLVLGVGMIFVLVARMRRGDVRWRTALWVGGAGAVLNFLAGLNQLSNASFSYNTTQSWSSFIATLLLSNLASAVGIGLLLVVLTAAAESLYRERFGGQVSVTRFLSWRGVRSKSFLMSMVLGLSLAALFFAYQTVFYLIANHFGAWAPADIPYDDLLNTKLPWAFVLFSGFFPAISEEFGFRMLAIPLFEKWFRYLWVAVIAASFLWGFGHSTYPNQPFYIRGVEVGLGGILLSWVMIRFGILTTVVWHYTVDALYAALLLLRAHDTYLRWSGATTALLALAPLLVAIIAYRVGHGFSPEPELTNAAEGSAPEPPPSPPAPDERLPEYTPIAGPNWTIGLIIAGALLAAFAVPQVSFHRAAPWRSDKDQAAGAAAAFLTTQGYDLRGYRRAEATTTATAGAHGLEMAVAAQQIFARSGEGALVAAYSGLGPPARYWVVRFFRPEQAEEFDVAVRADTGAVVGFSHALPETAPGAQPTLAAAEQMAVRFLTSQRVPAAGMQLKDAVQQQRPARTDTHLVWEATGKDLPSGITTRVEVDLAGSTVSAFARWYHVPDDLVRTYRKATLLATLLSAAKGLLYAAVAVLIFFLFYDFTRHGKVRWATLLAWAVAAGAVSAVLAVNVLPAAAAGYDTAQPWRTFQLGQAISVGVLALGGFLGTLVLLAPLTMAAPRVEAFTRRHARRRLLQLTASDALWTGLLSLAWILGWQRATAVVNARWHTAGLAALPAPPSGLTHWLPGLADLLGAPLHALWAAAGLGIVLVMLRRGWRDRYWRTWALGGVALLWIGSFPAVHSGGQFAQAAIFGGLALLLVCSFGALYLRNNPLAYFSAALVPMLCLPAINWLLLPTPGTAALGVVLLFAAAGWLAWLAWLAHGARHLPDAPQQSFNAEA